VRHAEEQDGAGAVADRQELDRPALARRADGLDAGDGGKVLDERARARTQLVEGQELPEVRDAGEKRGEITAQESSFEE
jgi:hypothetical protein